LKKIILLIILVLSFGNSSEVINVVEKLVDRDSFRKHNSLIKKIFSNEKSFIFDGKVDVLSVIDKLKKNGILRLFLDKPESIKISFIGGGNPIFFTKLISDSLQDLGYFKYRVLEVSKGNESFSWVIEFISEYILDPTLLNESLSKKGCLIVEVDREDLLRWTYKIDTSKADLNVQKISKGDKLRVKTPVFDYWFKVDEAGIMEFISNANEWHPYIALYDKNLYLLKALKQDSKHMKLRLKISEEVKYIKVSDIYQLNNLKNGLTIKYE
jgi:hypothetical protein